ncbi:MAG: alpha/beta hydrolase [Pseudomonadota bacterium]|nr:alpha/beta hydrolase [Pseudomonadota bacterium]
MQPTRIPPSDHRVTLDYAKFLPEQYRQQIDTPTSTWYTWRGHCIHMLRRRDATAGVRLLVVHGAGAHAAALWPLAALLKGVDLAAVDLPLYGDTVTARPSAVRYQDWIDLLVDLLATEDDGRPVVLLGGSIGGLLTVEAAARSGRVAAVVATCLLDPLRREARSVMTRVGALAVPFMTLLPLVRGPVARMPLRISWLAPLTRMGRDPRLGSLCAADSRGGHARIPLGFMAAYLQHPHDQARRVPVDVHLMHPEKDAWTPMALSLQTLESLPTPASTLVLRECGHFPLGQPGIEDMLGALSRIVHEKSSTSHAPSPQ